MLISPGSTHTDPPRIMLADVWVREAHQGHAVWAWGQRARIGPWNVTPAKCLWAGLSPPCAGPGFLVSCAFLEPSGRRGPGLSLGAHRLHLASISGGSWTPGRHCLLCQELSVPQQSRSQWEFPANTDGRSPVLTLCFDINQMLFPDPYIRPRLHVLPVEARLLPPSPRLTLWPAGWVPTGSALQPAGRWSGRTPSCPRLLCSFGS